MNESAGDAKGKAFVDFQNDVTARDIRLAVREGFRSVEHIKRYTTNGMATDQGRTSNLNALAIAAQALGQTIPGTGLTTFRAPYTPTTFGTVAGLHRGRPVRNPLRRDTARRARGRGGRGVRAGWAVAARALLPAVRARTCTPRSAASAARAAPAAGLFDASTIGKIEVVGPDAAACSSTCSTSPRPRSSA